MAIFDPIRMGASGASTGYEIERSIRMDGRDDQTNFRFTPSSQGDRRKFTISWWMKAGHFVSGDQNDNYLFSAVRGSNNPQFDITFNHERLGLFGVTGGSYSYQLITQRVFRDPTNWMHFVVAFDTANSTSSNRIKIYINGELQNNFDTVSYPSQDFQTAWNTNEAEENIGRTFYGSGVYNFDGYLAEIHNISSLALTPDSFGETDSITGQWIPKPYSGADGDTSCRWYLKFTDNSNNTAATIGKDYSGQSNNWTPYNIDTHNSVLDSPTNNFCTMNIIDKDRASNLDVRNGLLKPTTNHGFRTVRGTFGVTSGKWYWEVRTISMSDSFIGVMGYDTKVTTNRGGETISDIMLRQNDGDARSFANNYGWGGSSYAASGDILMFALDMDSGLMFFGKNGTWMNSANPANGTGFANYTSAEQYRLRRRTLPAVALYDNKSCMYNFGQDDTFQGAISATGNTDGNGLGVFKYAPPSGFLALCSKNLPDPQIANGEDHFEPIAYDGTNQNRSISGLSFTPDLLWGKAMEAGHDHQMVDVLRGTGDYFMPNRTDTQTASDRITAFNSDGFSLGTDSRLNANNQKNVMWCWDAGTTNVSDTGGTINVTRRTNTSGGLSIISYTGNGSGGATISHGLGTKPAWVIIKKRGNDNFMVYHHAANGYDNPQNRYFELNTTTAPINQARMTNDVAPTSTLFTLGSDSSVNQNGSNYIAYMWAQIEGYSDFGRYVGVGNSFNSYINVGFQPSWILVKRENTENWALWDTARTAINNEHNYNGRILRPDSDTTEGGRVSGHAIDICSNGFKVRMTDQKAGANDDSYIVMAFAKNPFKTSNSR